ncbi:MAG TPA: DUF928 domain-containing protein [Geminicoccaceae bacterium]|nr:DUF928 domain-containing protein [Geminicoccaceae bacterium]
MKILGRLRLPLDPRVGWIVLGGLLGLASALAYAQATGTVNPGGTVGAQGTAQSSIVYMPREPVDPNELMSSLLRVRHDFGAPEVTEAGGTRGMNPPHDLPDVLVLAPPKLAHSLSPQPTLYWYISGPTQAPVRLTLLDFESASPEPLLELDLGAVPAAGVYATSLTKHGIRLEPGHRYEWSVALEVNPEAYAEEPVAKTIFATAEPDPALLPKLADAPPLARIEALAAAGYWYDALDLLAQQIAAGDQSQPWRELSASLLEQARLQRVAAFARGDRGAQ